MSNSSTKAKPKKPAKPHKDFPLFRHATGRWAKKVKGKFAYFGKVADDPDGQAALEKWLLQKDDLLAGRRPRKGNGELVVVDLINRFLTSKLAAVKAGELSARAFRNYGPVCKQLLSTFGRNRAVTDLAADDFDKLRTQICDRLGLQARGVAVGQVKGLFKFAFDSGLIETPVRFGPAFKSPSRKSLQIERNSKGLRLFEAEQIRLMLDHATPAMKAQILLGINCGFGNSDCAHLTLKALDMDGGWANFPRPKTGILRRIPLWPETIAAISNYLPTRPKPADKVDTDIVFIMPKGVRYVRMLEKNNPANPDDKWTNATAVDRISLDMLGILTALKIKRPGLSFYALRHTFETIAGGSRDQIAVDSIMGHSRGDMASVYREKIEDERLLAVTNHVRKWLFGTKETK